MDERARTILLRAYWGSQGWKSGAVSDTDFAYCKSQNVMFDPVNLKHPDLVRKTIAARDAVSPKLVGQAFIASLATRKVWLRSALGSHGNCRDLVQHRFRPNPFGDMGYLCNVCSALRMTRKENLSILNFERVKWGGVRHSNLLYNALDLELLAQESIPKITPSDRRVLKKLLHELRATVANRETSAKLCKRWKPLFPSNSDELQTIVTMLSTANIIEIDGYKVVELDEDLLVEYLA